MTDTDATGDDAGDLLDGLDLDELSFLHRTALRTERTWDRVYRSLRDSPDHVTVLGYTGFGNATDAVVLARVLAQRPRVSSGAGSASRRVRAYRMARRFLTAELPGVAVRARLGAAQATGVSDDEGYVRLELSGHGLSGRTYGHPVELELPDVTAGLTVTVSPGRVMIPAPSAARMIISDIDDTVLRTGAMNPVELVARTLTGSAATRQGFAGTTALYRALRGGDHGSAPAPVAYVSASPWNLYDFLAEFLRRQDLPAGPMILRDFGVDERRLVAGDTAAHKHTAIEELLQSWDLPAVLVGDTGEHDPEIFAAVAIAHPGRVQGVLLRHVARGGRRAAVLRLGRELDDVPWIVGDDSASIAAQAEDAGLVPPGTAAAVAR